MEMPQNNQQNGKKEPNTWVKVIVLLALIVLLIIGILLPIKLVPNAVTEVKDFFSSIFNRSKVTLSVDKDELKSGEPFTLSWDGSTRTNGSYIFSYPCIDGVNVETSVNQPFEKVTCDTQYYFSPSTNEIELTITTQEAHSTDIPVILSFLNNSDTDAKEIGDLTLTVINDTIEDTSGETATTTPVTPVVPLKPAATSTPSTPKPATTTPVKTPAQPSAYTGTVKSAHRVSNPNGTADLYVAIIATGYLNDNAVFVRSQTVRSDMRAAVKFIVTNVGDKNSGSWNFTASLPSRTNPTYTAINRPNLGPDDSIEYVLGFENLNSAYENTVTITVDPQNYVPETTDVNNTASAKIINSQNGTYPTPDYPTYGKADLVARVVSATYNNNTATIRFEVQNMGGTESGSFRFRANLPTYSNNEYVSGYQNSLKAGEKVYFNLSFSDLQNYGNNYTNITVDPYNEVNESNENNNSIQATVYRY
jgi:hypothetical protein